MMYLFTRTLEGVRLCRVPVWIPHGELTEDKNMITLSDLTLEDLLPHRGRMLLIREIIEVDEEHAVTRCLVDDSWPLVSDDKVHTLILIELAAQTAGVCNGWDRIRNRGLDSEKTGWLVGIKQADFFTDNLPVGSAVLVRAENSYRFENLREVTCDLYMDKKKIATAVLQLFQL